MIVSVAELKARLNAYLRASRTGPVVVTRNGKAVGVLIGIDDEEEIERLLLSYSPRLQAILAAARRQIRRGRGVRHKDFWEAVERSPSPRP